MAGWLTTALARWGRPIDLPSAARAASDVLVELVAELLERLRHPVRAPLAVPAVGLQVIQQAWVGVIDHVAEDVEVVSGLVKRRDLDRRHDPDAEPGGCVDRLLHPVDAVVVAERHQLHAGRGGRLDDLGLPAAPRRNGRSDSAGRKWEDRLTRRPSLERWPNCYKGGRLRSHWLTTITKESDDEC